jgi:hypothetical protein
MHGGAAHLRVARKQREEGRERVRDRDRQKERMPGLMRAFLIFLFYSIYSFFILSSLWNNAAQI